jgi:hypothetical protein
MTALGQRWRRGNVGGTAAFHSTADDPVRLVIPQLRAIIGLDSERLLCSSSRLFLVGHNPAKRVFRWPPLQVAAIAVEEAAAAQSSRYGLAPQRTA